MFGSQLKIKNNFYAFGMAGENYTNQPIRSRGFWLQSYDENGDNIDQFNVIGNVVFHNKKNDKLVGHYLKSNNGAVGDDQGAIAGILAYPKTVYRKTLINELNYVVGRQQVEVVQQGYMIVNLVRLANNAYKNSDKFSANIGDFVYYDTISGKLTSIAPTDQMAQNSKFVRLGGSTVSIYNMKKPTTENSSVTAVIYLDLAGDQTTNIAIN